MAGSNAARRTSSSSSLMTVNRLLEPKECYKSPFGALSKDKGGATLLTRNTSSLRLRRRHTIEEGARGLQDAKKSHEVDPLAEVPKEKKDTMDCVAIKLALRYRLMLSEVKNIIREFLEAKRDIDGGIGRATFDKVMARIFDVPSVKESVSQSAYDACAAPDGINIEEFLSWYVQNMFTQVNGMNADVGKHQSESLIYSLASKYNVPIPLVDKMKTRFDSFDIDGSGTLDFDEFRQMFCGLMKVTEVNPDRLKRFWDQIKKTGRAITFEEFVEWHSKYHNPDTGASDEFDPAAPLRKFYEAYDPTVQRRASFASFMAKGHTVHT